LHVFDNDPTYVWSSKQSHLEYTMYNPYTESVVCEYMHFQKGSICKYQLKVLRITRPNISKGNIVQYLGSLYGTVQGGFKNLIAKVNGATSFPFTAPELLENTI
jgi:hypothetical protein